MAIVENTDDSAPAESSTCAALASESESAILLTRSSATDHEDDDEDTTEMLTVVSDDAVLAENAPNTTSSPAYAPTAATNGVAHKPADADQPMGDAVDGAGVGKANGIERLKAAPANGVAPPSQIQVVSAVSGKKMSIAEARAEFFNAAR